MFCRFLKVLGVSRCHSVRDKMTVLKAYTLRISLFLSHWWEPINFVLRTFELSVNRELRKVHNHFKSAFLPLIRNWENVSLVVKRSFSCLRTKRVEIDSVVERCHLNARNNESRCKMKKPYLPLLFKQHRYGNVQFTRLSSPQLDPQLDPQLTDPTHYDTHYSLSTDDSTFVISGFTYKILLVV